MDNKDSEVKTETTETPVKEGRPGFDVLSGKLKEIRTGEPPAEAKKEETSEGSEDSKIEETPKAEDNNSAELTIEKVDARKLEVARLRGWDDARILKYAKEDPGVLDDLVALAEDMEPEGDEAENPAAESPEESTPESKEVIDVDAMKGEIGEKGVALLKQMQAELKAVQTELAKTKTSEQAREADLRVTEDVRRFETASKKFDDAVKEFPELGVLKNLPRKKDMTLDTRNPSVQLRGKLWGMAEALCLNETAASFDEAVDMALQFHRSKKTKEQVTSEVVDELTARKKKFLPRPTHRNIPEIPDKHRDTRGMVTPDGKAALIQKAKEQAGLPT